MYRDKSLLPQQALRLAALGALMLAPTRYADLAVELRQFSGLVVGPSLDLLGSSIELLRFEGLITASGESASGEPASGESGAGDGAAAILTLTPAGRAAFFTLMDAPLRAPMNDVTRLVILLKLRFVHLLEADAQQEQLEILIDLLEGEAVRHREISARFANTNPFFGHWLAADIANLERRIEVLKRCRAPQAGGHGGH